jgi:type I restriction enzyme S subunit
MATYNFLPRSQLKGSSRFDAEYYQKKYLSIEKSIKRHLHTNLGAESLVFSKGIFNISASSYTDKGVPFVRISNLKGLFIDDDEIIRIPEKVSALYSKTALSKHDIILSKTATPAACMVYFESCNCSQDTIALKLKRDTKVTPQFLTCFLNTKYGFPLMERLFTGNIQMHLNLVESRNILVPVLSGNFQKQITKSIDDAFYLLIASKQSLEKAKNILLSSLGLTNWNPKQVKTSANS